MGQGRGVSSEGRGRGQGCARGVVMGAGTKGVALGVAFF